MKKKVKALIIATSIAAIAGIGAVSFAKWSAVTDVDSVDVSGNQTGTIETMGSFTATGDLDKGQVLMPWDQEDQLTADTKTLWTITVDEENLNTKLYDFTYSVKYKAQEDEDLGVNKLYVYTGEAADYAAPTGTSLGSDWTALGNTAVAVKTGTTIYIVLESQDANYETDKEKNFGVTISATASEKTATGGEESND